ncbi:MAG: threonylcarbamoyl-AMP synthase [Planctomycetota bacterium]|nr:threonylcarbamoyl-AMP synthase [Planctomycetota bacterium]
MKTEVLKLDGSADDMVKIRYAARLLQAGALVAFPTETVYGVGADARNPEALARLSQVKGRAENKPYALLCPSLRHAEELSTGFSRLGHKLSRIYWPGPLTLVVPRRGGGTVGLRISEHPVARALLTQCGFPLATPSANRSGSPREPSTAEMVLDELQGDISLVLDGGATWRGKPSTVVRVDNTGVPRILREGVVPATEIMEVARPTVLFVCTGNTCRSPMAEALCREALKGAYPQEEQVLPFRVQSAGTSAAEGHRADPMAIEAMGEMNIDITNHRTRALNPALLDGADWIFTMTWAHRESILKIMPATRDRVWLLSSRSEDIPDPVSKSIEKYRQVRDRIAHCMRDVIRVIGGSRA